MLSFLDFSLGSFELKDPSVSIAFSSVTLAELACNSVNVGPVLQEYEILSDGTEATAPAKPRVQLLTEWRLDAILLSSDAC
jgi:hypothetical protein